ncbi:MAG: F0F1 ATP synthase subunit A [Paludibacteraceae bacterium]|nr:F0F1 ATP synthase subunit A [Paludibacteraceae bacterium]
MNKLRYILSTLFLLFAAGLPVMAQDASDGTEEETNAAMESGTATEGVDAVGLIFGHIGDAYEYHITEIGGHPVSVPLPVIVHSPERGWFCFSSAKIAHGSTYNGFFISQEEKYNGKVVERNAQGELVRPFDLSITKNVFALLLSSALLLIIFLSMAHAYKKNPMGVPSKGRSMLEAVILYLDADIIRPALGKKSVRFAPYLLTVFFFILLNNLMGLVPVFPLGANLTGNISVTLVLALFTYIITNVFGTKTYWKDIFWPEVPVFLKTPVFPLMQIIEFISTLTKPIALMIRLFANIFAGHMIILVLISLIFIFTAVFQSAAVGGGTAVLSVLFSVFMYCLELLVAFIQAYVFTMLSAIFIGLAQAEHEEGHEKAAPVIAENNQQS